MRIAICVSDRGESERLQKWLSQYCELYGVAPVLCPFTLPESFFEAQSARRFEIVIMGFGGSEGFLHARRLRENDKSCRIIFMDDTKEYAVMGVRLHFTDFIVRPAEFRSIVRAMKLAGV